MSSQPQVERFCMLLPALLFLLLLTPSQLLGQTSSPPIPYHDYGACPFECCTYRNWSVAADTVLYKARSTSSGVAFRVKKGDRVTGLTGVVDTVKPGRALVKRPGIKDPNGRDIQARIGDMLYLLTYRGEDVFKVWLKGRFFDVSIYANRDNIQLFSKPQSVWWMKIKNRRGQTGWTKDNKNFGNIDACG